MISDAIKITAALSTIAIAVGGGLAWYVTKKEKEAKLASMKRQVGDNLDFIDAYIALMTSDVLSVKQLGELEKMRKDHAMKFATNTFEELIIMLAQSNGIYMTVRDAAKAHQKK